MKNGLRCIYCDNELSGNDRKVCARCSSKLPLVRKLLKMRLPQQEEPEQSITAEGQCVYCVDGICANAYNPMYAEPCQGDLLCKRERGADNGQT